MAETLHRLAEERRDPPDEGELTHGARPVADGDYGVWRPVLGHRPGRSSRGGGRHYGRRPDLEGDVAGAKADGLRHARAVEPQGCGARPTRSMSASTVVAISAMVATASTGYCPMAVSPESITAQLES